VIEDRARRPATGPARYPHEHVRHGTAKLLTLFHPASGQVRVKGVTSAALAALVTPLRLLLVLDNLTGHKTPRLVLWLVEHGVMPLYTPLSGSWLIMAESIQRILVRRALAGQTPTSPDDIIDWLEATARGWNADPTPFVWAGKRQLRRERSRQHHRHALGGSGACARRPLHRRPTALHQWRRSCQLTH
jgi:hypothetical protein